MSFWTLIQRSLQFHARAHLGVVLGASVAGAALIGALIVGDSVKASLRQTALRRLQKVHYALVTGDRFFRQDLGRRLQQSSASALSSSVSSRPSDPAAFSGQEQATGLLLSGTAARQDSSARANRVQIIGTDWTSWPKFAEWQSALPQNQLQRWRAGEVVFLNEMLARQLALKPGDEVILRVRKPSALALDAVITPRNDTSLALRLQVGAILPAGLLGDFDLAVNQIPTANAFLPLELLAQKLELAGRANLLLYGPAPAGTESKWLQNQAEYLNQVWSLDDAQLSVRSIEQTNRSPSLEPTQSAIEVTSSRVFLDAPVISATLNPTSGPDSPSSGSIPANQGNEMLNRSLTNCVGVLTYLANLIRVGDRATPYSMVTAAGPPYAVPGMNDNEILLNEWLANDLQVNAGDKVDLTYYVVDSGSHLEERTNSFQVRKVVALEGIYADRSLMPDFPGIAKAESTHDWDTGFPLVYKIREKDEAYWKAYRGTPKAFITLAAGQAMWANRFGSLTAVRYQVPSGTAASLFRDEVDRNLRAKLAPTELGLKFQPVREQALKAAEQSQDFGQLFLGFSFFLVLAALLLMALLFQLGLEQRVAEIGTFLALGFRPKQVRRMLLLEGSILALLGGVTGTAGGWLYAKGMLWGLNTIWNSAIGGFRLTFHVATSTVLTGIFASAAVGVLTIWFTLRKQARRPAHELLVGGETTGASGRTSRGLWVGTVSALIGLGVVAWAFSARQLTNAGAFFGGGSLWLVAGLAFASAWLSRLARSDGHSRPWHFTNAALAIRGCGRRHKRSLATVALLACGCFVIVSIGVFRQDANRDAGSRSSGTGGFALVGESTLPVVQDLNTQAGREFFGLNASDLAGIHINPFRVRQGDDASCLNLNRAQRPRLLGVNPESVIGRFSFVGVAKGKDSWNGWALLKVDGTNRISDDEIPAIGDANTIEWALGKKIGDKVDYTDERGQTFRLRLVGAVANSILQGSLIIDEAEFVKRFPGESGYRFFLADAPLSSEKQVLANLSRALQDVGLELEPAVQRLNAFNAVQNTYLSTFQILGGLGLLLGSGGLGVIVLRNVLERRGELALLLAVGFRRRGLRRVVLTEHGALLFAGLGLGILSGAVAVLPSLLSSADRLPYSSLALTFLVLLLNGTAWTWLATSIALRGNLLQALRNE